MRHLPVGLLVLVLMACGSDAGDRTREWCGLAEGIVAGNATIARLIDQLAAGDDAPDLAAAEVRLSLAVGENSARIRQLADDPPPELVATLEALSDAEVTTVLQARNEIEQWVDETC